MFHPLFVVIPGVYSPVDWLVAVMTVTTLHGGILQFRILPVTNNREFEFF
ncbi:hypothetical protein [Nitrosomonas sp.]|nr:hypothetical protein [Nitrosomonas sp.]